MKQEEPQIHGKYWRHETGGRYKQERQSTERAGETAGTEKKPGDPESPCGEESGGRRVNEKRVGGRRNASSGKGTGERNRKPKAAPVQAAGRLVE